MYSRFLKRVLDIVASSSALLALSPLIAIIAAAVRLQDRGPALFRQKRVGSGGRLFTLLKFRSMPLNTGDLPSDQVGSVKITRVGRFIRRTNLDELPQLLNILKGDMSIVGPRPSLPTQAELVALRSANNALACRPGLTGLAQVNSYSGMPVSEKARLDGVYASGISLVGDIAIIVRTFAYLLKPPPVY